MKKFLLGFVGLVLVIGLAGFIALRTSESLQDRLIAGAIDRRVAQVGLQLQEDSLYVFICGSGSPMPDPDRASACTAIVAGGDIYLVDVGPGSAEVLQNSGLEMARLKGVFLTHFHSDHIGDLGEVAMQSWAAGRTGPLTIYGPAGVSEIAAGFERAYRFDEGYRVAHHGANLMRPGSMKLEAQEVGDTPFMLGGLTAVPIKVAHDPVEPAYGYRFNYGDRAAVVSGDTVPNAALIEEGQGADLLVHEALSKTLMTAFSESLASQGRERLSEMLMDTLDYHTSPREAAEVSNEMGVQLLVYSHIVPPLPNGIIERAYLRGVSDIRKSGVVIAADGMLFELPIGGDEILQR